MKKLLSLIVLLVCVPMNAEQHSTMTADQKITYTSTSRSVMEQWGRIRLGGLNQTAFWVENKTSYPVYVRLEFSCGWESFHINPKSIVGIEPGGWWDSRCEAYKITGYIYYSGDTPVNLVEWHGTEKDSSEPTWAIVEKGQRTGWPTIELKASPHD